MSKHKLSLGLLRRSWILLLAAELAFLLLLWIADLLPLKWFFLLIGVLVLIDLLGLLYCRKDRARSGNLLGMTVNVLLSLLLVISGFYMPTLRQRLNDIFRIEGDEGASVHLDRKPFFVYIAGNDQEGELSTYGRYDVNLLVGVDPRDSEILIISIPRDSYLPNPAYDGAYDKLTHMGVDGIRNSLTCLSDTFEITVPNYVIVNFTTFRLIIDALNGIEIENPYAFTSRLNPSYSYPEGPIVLNGDAALFYVRERYNLPDGDFGRNAHQSLVLQAVIRKISSPAGLMNLDKLLQALDGSFLTNISQSEIFSFLKFEMSKMPDWQIRSLAVKGEVGWGSCAAAGGESLSIVYPYEEDIAEAAAAMQELLQRK